VLTPYKDRFRKLPEGAARFFLRIGFTPNGITLLGLVLGLVTCLLFAWNRNAVLFGFLMIFFGLFDAVDGAAARITNQVTKFGSYLDAICDRVFESAALLAAAYVTEHWVLSFCLLGGIFLVSYSKARAAMEVAISNTEWPDFMERTERDIIFAVGVIIWGFFPGTIFGFDIYFWMMLFLNLAVFGTVIQRILRAKKFIELRR